MLTYAFIFALLSMVLIKYWLNARQVRCIIQHRNAVPKQFQENLSLKDHERAADYSVAHLRLNVFESFVDAALYVVLLLMGGLQWLHLHILFIAGT